MHQELLEDPDREDQRSVGSDSVDSCLEVGQFDHVVLQGDVGVVGELGEALDADHEDHQVGRRQVLQGLPDAIHEMPEIMLRSSFWIDLLQPEHGEGEDEDEGEDQAVVLVDGQAPGPALQERDRTIRIIGRGSIQEECLNYPRNHAESEANSLTSRQDLTALGPFLQLTQFHGIPISRHIA